MAGAVAAFWPGVWTIGVYDPTTAPTGDTPGAANGGCEYSAPCLGDFDLDGQISAADLSTLLGVIPAELSAASSGGDTDQAYFDQLFGEPRRYIVPELK